MNAEYKRQVERAEQSQKAARKALAEALASTEGLTDERWRRVRALQAQAQLDTLDLIATNVSTIADGT